MDSTPLSAKAQQALCLCALVDAVLGVRELAQEGRTEFETRSSLLAAIFEFDADSPIALYGTSPRLVAAIAATEARFAKADARHDEVTRLAAQVLALSRRLRSRPEAGARLLKALEPAVRQRQQFGLLHEYTVQSLAQAYVEAISPLAAPIRIFGNATYLSQPRIAAQVRALMLAAMRAAVLWRHLGGNGWSLYFRQRHWRQVVHALPAQLGLTPSD
ncbi:hypothetical protein C7S18_10770 [Ahniella affigens]|uniref:High frequency lysogenization protein HflD homolog n=1 Tax=Ahniella affigens TaxID=2021234 RepID=A0A2P1PS49_9GAMM|nr:DUF489 family protein [Ahniella affigens]AVP97652.1 hypothetical protein C7S18_10770 [Ahniella affigens]